MPQQECPLVSEGHQAHHGDEHEEDDDHDDDNNDKDHHEDADDIHHGLPDMIHNDKSGSLRVKDFQTENMSYYTLARDYPDSFARKGNEI